MATPLIKGQIIGKDIAKALKGLAQVLPREVMKILTLAGMMIQETAQWEMIRAGSAARGRKALGPPLKTKLTSRTSVLRSGIKVIQRPSEMAVLIGPSAWYGKMHELGLTYHRKELRPGPGKKALRFVVGGVVVFAKYVKAQTVTVPKRPFLKPAARKRQKDIQGLIVRRMRRVIAQVRAATAKKSVQIP